jgi:uncharacterized protein (TIGR02996 family)
MNAQQAFLRTIADNPNDSAVKRVFADWLEQNRQSNAAELIRLHCQLQSIGLDDPRLPALRRRESFLLAVPDPAVVSALVPLGKIERTVCLPEKEWTTLVRCPAYRTLCVEEISAVCDRQVMLSVQLVNSSGMITGRQEIAVGVHTPVCFEPIHRTPDERICVKPEANVAIRFVATCECLPTTQKPAKLPGDFGPAKVD